MASSAGTKVTKDPEAFDQLKNENPGVVTSDSLAGQSVQGGGSFGSNTDARGPMGQPSSSTTTNTTQTFGATKLDPAPTAEAREAQQGWSENSALNAGGNLGKDAGVGPTYNVAAGGSDEGFGSTGSGQGSSRPKGTNLQEGGFSSDEPNASFTTDIGGKNDPGRAALGRLQEADVPVAGGAGARQTEVSGDGQYDTLDETSA